MNDGAAALARAFDLELVETLEDAWELLLRGGPRRSMDHWRGVELFKRFHNDGGPDALLTAVLVCTDRRWKACTHRLVRGVEEAGILTDEQLDELAEGFVDRDAIDVLVGLRGSKREQSVRRLIAPPFRRWASRRLAGRGRPVDELLQRALELESKAGDAIAAGVVDAAASMDETTAAAVIDIGLAWPSGTVRIVALERLADRDGVTAATSRAARDPVAKVRAWSAKLAERGRQPEITATDQSSPRPDLRGQLF